MNESAFTNVALDSITNYIMKQAAQKKRPNVFECLQYISEQMKFSLPEVTEAFGDIVKAEVIRANNAYDKVDESAEKFSQTLLTEADTTQQMQQKVDAAEKTQKTDVDVNAQAADDKKTNKVRQYFAFVNFNKGQMYICSEARDAGNVVNKALENVYNFLSRCEKPTFTNGILAAPITLDDAKRYCANKNIKYIDLTPEQKQQTK